jgi:hypothetical protein
MEVTRVSKFVTLNLKLFVFSLCNLGSAFAAEATCPTNFQVINYSPQACYSEFNEQNCTDTCSAADPVFQPSCFKQLSIPCDTVADLKNHATGFQQRGSYAWFHVTDLLTYDALLSDLNIFQQELYLELYGEFVNTPKNFGFSPASDQFRRENFRLSLLSALDTLTTPLRYAALYRRYSLGISLETQLNDSLATMMNQIDSFPYYSNTQRNELKAELEIVVTQQTRYWQLLKKYNTNQIAEGRVSLLNKRLKTFENILKSLSPDLQTVIINKSLNFDRYIDINLQKCGLDLCYEEIVTPAVALFYPDFDLRLLKFEQILTALNNEAAALSNIYDGNYQVVEPHLLKLPDFSGFINNKLSNYKTNRSYANLERLATAINIAYLSKNQTGKETLLQLTQISDVTNNQGLSTLASFESMPILLSNEFSQINPELTNIQQESFQLSLQGRSIISQIMRDGHTQALLDHLTSIIARLNELAARSVVIANVEQFTDDRLLTVNWTLFDTLPLNEAHQLIEIEYFDYNGMFWTPKMSAGLSDLFPAIHSLSTVTGSLLPNGIAVNSQLNTLQLTLKQAAYSACSPNNKEINMVVKITDEQGIVSRQVLTATLDQI